MEQEIASRHPPIRTALCHEWFTTYGGADQVAARLAETLQIPDIFTFAKWNDTAAAFFPSREVQVVGPDSRWVQDHWHWLLPYMPRAWARVNLNGYDLVVTSSHSCVNAIRPRPQALHVSYCHTPMRYAWEWRSEMARIPVGLRAGWPVVAWALRAADRRWAQRVDLFLANSRFVAKRIKRFYDKPSLVIHPPIDTSYWTPGATRRDDFFLLAGRLVAYKRPDIVVRAAVKAGASLVVAGSGPMLGQLRRIANSRVTFIPQPTSATLRDLYRRARAYVFAGIEDFGMAVVEAQACGTPIIAYNDGGVRETVIQNRSGILLADADHRTFAHAMGEFDGELFDPAEIRAAALRFDKGVFDQRIQEAISAAVAGDWVGLSRDPAWVAVDRD